ncbi:MAG: hypothetical protein U5J83_18605 [Bryobacterales bacterium]|nr:hypothetical protein [Bryobacterales bacterium]
MAFETWVQLSPMALPRLVAGENEFTVTVLGEAAMMQNSAWHRGVALPGEAHENLDVHEEAPYLRPESGTRPGILQFALPDSPKAKQLRVSVLARALPGTDPQGIRVALSMSEDGGESWKELRRFVPHAEQEDARMWFNHRVDIRGAIARGTLLQVAVEGGGLERVATSLLAEADAAPAGGLRVTHHWLEGNEPKAAVREVDGGREERQMPGARRAPRTFADPGTVD